MRSQDLIIPLLLSALVACDKKDEGTAKGGPQASAPVPVTSAPAPVASAATSDDLETEEDFEDEAEKASSPDTLASQLEALEKEINNPY